MQGLPRLICDRRLSLPTPAPRGRIQGVARGSDPAAVICMNWGGVELWKSDGVTRDCAPLSSSSRRRALKMLATSRDLVGVGGLSFAFAVLLDFGRRDLWRR